MPREVPPYLPANVLFLRNKASRIYPAICPTPRWTSNCQNFKSALKVEKPDQSPIEITEACTKEATANHAETFQFKLITLSCEFVFFLHSVSLVPATIRLFPTKIQRLDIPLS
jgi:hypothetical protein